VIVFKAQIIIGVMGRTSWVDWSKRLYALEGESIGSTPLHFRPPRAENKPEAITLVRLPDLITRVVDSPKSGPPN
jgi:hypothetical protein